MVRLLEVLVEPQRACSYVAGKRASLTHQILLDVTPYELEALLERGWRRFGPDYFRPTCTPCFDCIPTRIALAGFTPSRSQRRVLAKTTHLRWEFGPPRCDAPRMDLYRRWHQQREHSRGWEASPLDERSYHAQFTFPHSAARELAFYDHERLVGVSICDETPRALSAVYFFFDPSYAKSSLGVRNVLTLAALGLERRKSHLYLGYWVKDCPSLTYKGNFRPLEILEPASADLPHPEWREA